MTKLHWGHRGLVCGGDGEGSDDLRIGGPTGATGTSMKQVQHVGQQGVCPVHFLSVRCSMSDVPAIALARNHCIAVDCSFPLAFCYHKVGCGPKFIFCHLLPGEGRLSLFLSITQTGKASLTPGRGWRTKLAPFHGMMRASFLQKKCLSGFFIR